MPDDPSRRRRLHREADRYSAARPAPRYGAGVRHSCPHHPSTPRSYSYAPIRESDTEHPGLRVLDDDQRPAEVVVGAADGRVRVERIVGERRGIEVADRHAYALLNVCPANGE